MGFISPALAESQSWEMVEQVFGKPGLKNQDMFKITFPRTDLKVKVGTIPVEPGLALTSWVAFKPMDGHFMAMGDLVLLDQELHPVQEKLIANGFTISGIHNHIVGESPSVIYMHFDGHGVPVQLAKSIKAILAVTGTPVNTSMKSSSAAAMASEKTAIETILKVNGKHNGQVLQFAIPRQESILENGMEVPAFMGMATTINFQRADNQKMATTGDFVLLPSEVNPVVQALVEHGIAVTAVHNHMLNESPRLLFLHFWGVNTPENLAKGLRSALNKTKSRE